MGGIWKTPAAGLAVLERYAQFLAHWPKPCEHLRVPTSQGETFVIASGTPGAPAVVMLHGSASNSVVWMRDAALLGERFGVYAVDMIGEPGLSAPSRPALASGAYDRWLDEVLSGLGVERAALVGISLGGWLALEYATKHPERVSALALLCPGGVGRHRNVLLWALPLLALGPWGRRKFMQRIGAPQPNGEASPAMQAFAAFNDMINSSFRVRRERLPGFSDAALGRLTMPVLTILGGRDVFIDSPGTRDRLAANIPHADIRYLPQASHFLIGHTDEIDAFLRQALIP
ncbi:alpha/beta hydrolase [Phenylobacterium sp.]|uniref:alpha/beta fold hydrolase n=1 Tax=Phenylobacterium sp. TaxID=1871053 RepID=UPI00286B044A|nr:alpha/beta hydrolase [Phenylobacterium sp.]